MSTGPVSGSSRRLAELIGPALAARLVDAWGGTEPYIPKRIGPDHPLVAIVGLEAAEKLAGALGGRHLNIARGAGFGAAMARVYQALDAGADPTTAALSAGCTTRFVRKAKAKLKGDAPGPRVPAQGNLFDR